MKVHCLISKKKKNLTLYLYQKNRFSKALKNQLKTVQHFMKTANHEPILSAPYKISPAMKVKQPKLQEIIEEGIITNFLSC